MSTDKERDGRPDRGGTDVIERTDAKDKVKKPKMYRVVLLNDDYTPMDFVVYALQRIFHKGIDEAMTIMMSVHQKGTGTAGVFTLEVAETKAMETIALAKGDGHPLNCVVEPEA